jgi:hypothetical protein
MSQKAGKYSEVVSRLPHLEEEPNYQAKVNFKKAELIAAHADDPATALTSAASLARKYQQFRTLKEDIETELSDLQIALTAVEQLLTERYEVEGVTNMKLEDGSSVGIQFEPYAQVVDRQAARQWAVANGYEDRLMLPWQLMNAVTKEHLLNGEPEPDGVKAHTRAKIVLRRG